MFDVQQIAEIREMKEKWVIPPQYPPLAVLDCDEEIREWLQNSNAPTAMVLTVTHHGATPDAQCAMSVLTLRQRFFEQANKWDKETAHVSSSTKRYSHPSYEAIRGMAEENRDEVIDLLLQDMQANRREWFRMLSYLTQENPIQGKDVGKLDKMIDAWLTWAQKRR